MECHTVFIAMLSVPILNVIVLIIIMNSAIIPNIIVLN
jgi:hypothetical protein